MSTEVTSEIVFEAAVSQYTLVREKRCLFWYKELYSGLSSTHRWLTATIFESLTEDDEQAPISQKIAFLILKKIKIIDLNFSLSNIYRGKLKTAKTLKDRFHQFYAELNTFFSMLQF